jgi:hypothetical protein
MLTVLLNLLILFVVALLVFYVAKYVLAEANADEPIRKIVLLVLLIVFVVALVNIITGHAMWGPVIVVR